MFIGLDVLSHVKPELMRGTHRRLSHAKRCHDSLANHIEFLLALLFLLVTANQPTPLRVRPDSSSMLCRKAESDSTTMSLNSPHLTEPETQSKAQPSHWRPFRFLSLPPELRNMVYTLVAQVPTVTQAGWPRSSNQCRQTSAH